MRAANVSPWQRAIGSLSCLVYLVSRCWQSSHALPSSTESSSDASEGSCSAEAEVLLDGISSSVLAAAKAGHLARVKELVAVNTSGLLKEVRDDDGNNVLHFAVLGAHEVMLSQDISKHVEVLEWAQGRAQELLASGTTNISAALCPLFGAVSLRVYPALRAMLRMNETAELQACLSQRDAENRTVLLHALQSHASGMARLFLHHPDGISTEIRKRMGLSAGALGSVALNFRELTRAAGNGAARSLLSAGADPWITDLHGRTALHVAASEGQSEVVNLMLKRQDKASLVSAKARGGWTAAMLASEAGFKETALRLLGEDASDASEQAAATATRQPQQEPLGGWYPPHMAGPGSTAWVQTEAAKPYDMSRCDFQIVECSAMTKSAFIDEHVVPGRPALLAGCAAGWPAASSWSPSGLIERYGDIVVPVGPIAYPEMYGLQSRRMSVRDLVMQTEARVAQGRVVRSHDFVIDADIVAKTGAKVLEDMHALPIIEESMPVLTEFSFSPPLTGANLHFHGAVFSALVQGHRRWALLPPAHAYFSMQHAKDWFDSESSKGSEVMHCMQRAGDVMFVPRNWAHAVLSIQTSVSLINEY